MTVPTSALRGICLNCGEPRNPPNVFSTKLSPIYMAAWKRDEFCSRVCCESYLAKQATERI